ncbi:MAG: HlyC/CorC family transporter [Rhodospirillaceae bacterium]|nr:HlyC/CorC family transporter [Rhodospirillaceae bacterium]
MLLTAGAIFILLVLSAFFSGSETALTAASKPLMHQMELSGNRRAGLVNRMMAKKDRLIGAILLGNNLVNILASALATSLLITVFGETGVVYATIGMTLLVLIFSEILPKTYAFRNASRMALTVSPIINFILIVFSPFVYSINLFVRGLLFLFRIDLDAKDVYHSPTEEIRGTIEMHADHDDVEQHRHMLRSVLDLADVQVGEIMIHRRMVATLNAGNSIEKIITEVLGSPYTRIPIWKGSQDNIVGVLHAKALLREIRAHESAGKSIDDIDIISIAAKPWFVPEYTLLSDQLQAFRSRREHFSLVVDEYGSLLGIVTLEDILEEIVGDISDEHDISVPGVHLHPDGSFVVQGDVTIRDLNRQFDWRLPDEEAATAAGLILHEARRIPEVGQNFMFHGFRFEIMRRHHQQITALRITPPLQPEDNA